MAKFVLRTKEEDAFSHQCVDFLLEFQLCQNIITFHELLRTTEHLMYVHDEVEIVIDVYDYTNRNPLPESKAKPIFKQLVKVLQYIQNKECFCFDVRPGNVTNALLSRSIARLLELSRTL